jgi:hypothetical protein
VPTEAIDKELDAFDAKLDELLTHHAGKFAVFKDGQLIDTFTTELEAYQEGVRRFGSDPFLLRQVLPKDQPAEQMPALFAGLIDAPT